MKEFFVKFFSFLLAILMALAAFFGGQKKPDEPNPPVVDDTVKNVIFMIGDGMGFNSINKTVSEENLEHYNMADFQLNGESRTRSANKSVTDSAAGGTALACGVRVNNDCVAVYPSDIKAETSYPMNLIELAIENGKSAGIVTTDSTAGATPASFSSHTSSRKNEADITAQQLESKLTLIWGKATSSFSAQTAKENGFEVITNLEQMNALEEGTRSFGQFTNSIWHNYPYKKMPMLSEMTSKAIDLVDDDEDGFFLMIEGAHIDKNSHSNDGKNMKDALLAFDNAIGVALEYARTHSNTLVIVTADHETGGITEENGVYTYTTGGHTGVNVPLLVYGYDAFIEPSEVIDNSEIAVRTAKSMKLENFPREIVR